MNTESASPRPAPRPARPPALPTLRLRPSLTLHTALTGVIAFAVLVLAGCASPGPITEFG